MDSYITKLIQDGIVDEVALKRLEKYVSLFQSYNKHTNLSAVREERSIWLKHIVDSLMLLTFENIKGKVIDIGTGGGVPGIPLAIACNDIQVTLLDSVGKKVKACDHFIEQLKLTNVSARQACAEQLGQEKEHSHAYDVVVSRATAYLPTVLAWSEQLVKPGGKIILYKIPSAGELADGAAAGKYLGVKLQNNYIYILEDQERHLLVYTPQNKKRVAKLTKNL